MTVGIPRVSVLLPVRDAGATLSTSLRSIQRQSEPRFECVVVDDGSRDDSAEVARKYSASDPRFRVLSRPRRGLVAALNDGARQCRADLVARMDADDWMQRERLATQADWLDSRPELAAVGSHVRCFPRAALGPGMRAYEQWLASIDTPERVRDEAYVECPIAHPTLMIRRAVLDELPYRDLDWPEDYDLFLRLLAAGHEAAVVPRRLLGWRQGERRLSRTDPRYGDDRFTACKAAFLAETFLAGRSRYVLWGYGGTGKALRRALASHDRRLAAVVELHPRRIGQTIHGAPVIPPDDLPAFARDPLLVSVAGAEARARIRAALVGMRFREGIDYVCAA